MTDTTPCLRALTPEAEDALHGSAQALVDTFPFRVGRDSREEHGGGFFARRERRRAGAAPNNDLYLRDRGRVMHISRAHFQIERTDEGGFELVERGSACGTLVGNEQLGGQRQSARCALRHENVIVLGGSDSPYVFQFLVE